MITFFLNILGAKTIARLSRFIKFLLSYWVINEKYEQNKDKSHWFSTGNNATIELRAAMWSFSSKVANFKKENKIFLC